MAAEDRWVATPSTASPTASKAALSLPLVLDGDSIGALNLFGTTAHAFAEPDVERARAFTDQAATALAILVRQSSRITLDDQLREALATRAVIDQALGILMYAQKISASAAFEILRHASQTSNRKVSVIAAELIQSMTGHQFKITHSAKSRILDLACF